MRSTSNSNTGLNTKPSTKADLGSQKKAALAKTSFTGTSPSARKKIKNQPNEEQRNISDEAPHLRFVDCAQVLTSTEILGLGGNNPFTSELEQDVRHMPEGLEVGHSKIVITHSSSAGFGGSHSGDPVYFTQGIEHAHQKCPSRGTLTQ